MLYSISSFLGSVKRERKGGIKCADVHVTSVESVLEFAYLGRYLTWH